MKNASLIDRFKAFCQWISDNLISMLVFLFVAGGAVSLVLYLVEQLIDVPFLKDLWIAVRLNAGIIIALIQTFFSRLFG